MKRVAKWVGIVLAALILIVISLPLFVHVDQFRPALEAALSSALGRQVTLGNLHLKVLTAEVTADDLTVSEDAAFGKPAFLRASAMHVGVDIVPFLLSQKLVVRELSLDQPQIDLIQAPSGSWNFSTLGETSNGAPSVAPAPPSASGRVPLDLSVNLIRISNGRITLSRTAGHWKPLVLDGVNLQLRDFSSTTAFPFLLTAKVRGGGTLQLNGKAGPMNPTDSALTPLSVSLKAANLDLAGSGLNDFAPFVTGLASFDGSGQSDGVTLHVKGKLRGEKLVLAKGGSPSASALELDFTVHHNLQKHLGTVEQADAHIRSAVAHLTGTYAEQGDSMTLNMKAAGPNMPVQALAALLPSLAIALPEGTHLDGGSISLNVTLNGPVDRLVTAGSISMNGTRLMGFDLSKQMGPIEKLAGIKSGPDMEIQTLSADVRSAPEGVTAQAIDFIAPAIGQVTGAGTVSPANQLDFKMIAKVHATGLLAPAGNQPIPFAVAGTVAKPIFKPDIAAAGKAEITGVGKDVGKGVTVGAKKTATGIMHGLAIGKKQN